ncbi:MAG: beta-xylosidase, partial [Mucilaginibacter sp.]|nr:beta-xylosidase [Mucilaginibacter sp.]
FQDAGAIGRVCHLEPVKWQNDWPFIGVDNDGNGIGEPVSIYPKPNVKKSSAITTLQASDEFNKPTLGLQWQWNHNPVDDRWSLKKSKGYLSLTAMQSADNKHAKNTITQKLMGRRGEITTVLYADEMMPGQKAGLCLLGNYIHEIGLVKTDSSLNVYADNNGKLKEGVVLKQNRIFLRVLIDLDHNTVMQYSLDGKTFTQLGDACTLSNYNYWKAVRPALFSYNTKQDGGTALFDWFRYLHDGLGGGL